MTVKCKVCGWEGKQIGTGHLITHKMTAAEYKVKFPGANLTSQEVRDQIREKAKARPPASRETNQKISESMKKIYHQSKGFPLKEKNINQRGIKNDFFGKSHSKKTKEHLSKTARRWLLEAYANGKKISPFKYLGNGKGSSKIEKKVLSRISKFGFIHNLKIPFDKGCYQIDFAEPKTKLAIELDSKLHEQKKDKIRDQKKDLLLQSKGWKVIRFKTNDQTNPGDISSKIIMALKIQIRRGYENKSDPKRTGNHHPL